MAKTALKEIAPWLGDNACFPRVGDDGFDEFDFTPEQVEIIAEETREETALNMASDIIRALSKLDMDSERDFLRVVKIAAETVV